MALGLGETAKEVSGGYTNANQPSFLLAIGPAALSENPLVRQLVGRAAELDLECRTKSRLVIAYRSRE